MGDAKDFRQLFVRLQRMGCTVERTRGHHYRVTFPGRDGMVILAGTPTDTRAYRNGVAQIRRTLGLSI